MFFIWDKFYKELEIRVFNFLKVVSVVVSDILVVLVEKKFMYILYIIVIGFYGRSQEMFGLYYCIVFLFVYGGCIQRVIFLY